MLEKSREISRERKYDEVDRKRFKRDDKEENINKTRLEEILLIVK